MLAKNKFTLVFLIIIICLTALGMSSLTVSGADKSYVSGKTLLEIDGVMCGFVKRVDGGAISAEVIKETNSPSYFAKKHIGNPKYEEIIIEIDASMNKIVYDWISSMMTMKSTRKNGAIVFCNYDMTSTKRMEFKNAFITEVTFPVADGSSRESSYIKIKIAPEYIKNVTTEKKKISYTSSSTQKWLASNFRFNIDGLTNATTKTNKVEAIIIKQNVVTDNIGNTRDYAKESGKLEFPNIEFTLTEAYAQPVLDWHNSFVILGDNNESKEKSGYLEFLSTNMKSVLFRLDFKNLGIFRVAPSKSESNKDTIQRYKAELYCERIEMHYQPGSNTQGTGSNKAASASITTSSKE